MRILLSGGGTAGHVNPAVAIADAILEKDGTASVAFVGRSGGDEYTLVEKRAYPLYRINAAALAGKNPIKALKSLTTNVSAMKKAHKIIKDFDPHVIVGTGGYVCAPIILCGRLMKIPTVIHESNAYPGLTTRMLSGFADKVLLNFDSCRNYLKSKNVLVVGNPLVNDFSSIDRDSARKKLGIGKRDFLIASFGGSGGARVLNSVIIDLMRSYSIKTPQVRHIHAVGKKYYPEIKKTDGALCRGARGCKITPYIDDMPTVMNAADLVISRAGAMTLSEISAVGVPSILIPSPNVADDHQTKNAAQLELCGAAMVIEEKDLNLRILLDTVRELEEKTELRENMAPMARMQYSQSAKTSIVDEILSVCKK